MTFADRRLIRRLAAVSLLASAAFALPARADHPLDQMTFAFGAPVLNLDPGSATDSQAMTVRYQIMESLVEVNAATGGIDPLLATSWEVSADGLAWTFHLREGVTFHDGNPMTSADVIASLNRILSPSSGLSRSNDLRDIAAVEAVDPMTVKITLKQPVGAFLQIMALDAASVVSHESIEKYGNDIAWHPVGTGPFKFDSHVAEQSITLLRNDAYWGKKPALSKVTFVSVPEANTRMAMLETGEADVVINVPATEVDRLKQAPGVALLTKPNTRVAHIGFNTQKAPVNDVRVRQAIAYAIDRPALVKGIMRGLAVETDSIISPMVAGYQAQALYPYDPAKAKALLAEAGFSNGGPKLHIWTPQGRYYQDRETMIAVQAMLKKVGIDATVDVIDWSSYLDKLRRPVEQSESELYMLAWESNVNDIQYILDTVFASSRIPPAGWNTMYYTDPASDALADQIRVESDPAKRAALIDKEQRHVMEQAPWVPLYSYVQVTGYNAAYKGIDYLPSDTYRLKAVTFGQ